MNTPDVSMQAIVIREFGGPERLELASVPRPEPGPGEVRVRVAFAAVNPVDWKIREGYLADLFPHAFPLIPGWDLSGVIDATGEGSARFRVGDPVYAYARKAVVQAGAYAEYIVLDEAVVAAKPASLTLEQAATIPLAGLTAWQILHRFGKPRPGRSVLVQGGSGGVGSFAIPFARELGARVTATAGPGNQDYLRELGAHRAVDYREPGALDGERFDLVLDAVGGETLERSYALVAPGGALVSIVDEPDGARLGPDGAARAAFHFVSPDAGQLAEISALFDAGRVRVPSFETLPLAQAAEAHRKSQSGRVRGKLLLRV